MTKQLYKVSIIIPTYNSQKNIEGLLKSIKKQTYKNIEVIVVDDGSSDNTVKVARKYTKNVYARKHAERSIQRNFGAKKASGKYLVFLDSDMELKAGTIESIVTHFNNSKHKGLIIPELTAGTSWLSSVRRFERDMYKGDSTIEVARAFEKKVFDEMEGYDKNLTGAEDYDLPKRVSQKYSIGWSKVPLVHHEEKLTLAELLKKKYYYAGQSVAYADKHPELVASQGTIIFRKAYIRHWREFLKHPFTALSFVFVRVLTTIAAVAGYISEAGFSKFFKTLIGMFKK